MAIEKLQIDLRALGYDPGPIDGAMGPKTRRAIKEFQAEHGLIVDGVAGPETLSAIARISNNENPNPNDRPLIPWCEELMRRKGMHEDKDFEELYVWLQSAGSAVNPRNTPWCGDAVETALLRALPDEAVPSNPMLAINWKTFGLALEVPSYGAIMVFWRGSPSSWKGHVGFYTGEDDTHYHILGGNQSNAITITRLAKTRLRTSGIRWPLTWPLPTSGRIIANADGLLVTHNEA